REVALKRLKHLRAVVAVDPVLRLVKDRERRAVALDCAIARSGEQDARPPLEGGRLLNADDEVKLFDELVRRHPLKDVRRVASLRLRDGVDRHPRTALGLADRLAVTPPV